MKTRIKVVTNSDLTVQYYPQAKRIWGIKNVLYLIGYIVFLPITLFFDLLMAEKRKPVCVASFCKIFLYMNIECYKLFNTNTYQRTNNNRYVNSQEHAEAIIDAFMEEEKPKEVINKPVVEKKITFIKYPK